MPSPIIELEDGWDELKRCVSSSGGSARIFRSIFSYFYYYHAPPSHLIFTSALTYWKVLLKMDWKPLYFCRRSILGFMGELVVNYARRAFFMTAYFSSCCLVSVISSNTQTIPCASINVFVAVSFMTCVPSVTPTMEYYSF